MMLPERFNDMETPFGYDVSLNVHCDSQEEVEFLKHLFQHIQTISTEEIYKQWKIKQELKR